MRTIQVGLKFEELFLLRKGEVLDLFAETINDRADWQDQATQEDIDHFFD